MAYVIVFIGGGIGAMLRFGVNRATSAVIGGGFPYATFAVNMSGGFLMGVLAGLLLAKDVDEHPIYLLLGTGVLGGFTTFSAFSLEAAQMWQRGAWAMLGTYVAGSVVCSIMALFIGLAAAKAIS